MTQTPEKTTDAAVHADVVVVGNGLIGAAATRHLAESGVHVICIGAPSSGPDVRGEPESEWPDHRVYASHNDAARLTRLQDRDPQWAVVTKRAVADYRTIEAASGVTFFHDVGCLIASRIGGDGNSADPRAVMSETGVAHSYWEPGDPAWNAKWPDLAFPDTHYVIHEPAPAGYLQPKRLIEAQNVLAKRAGADVIADTVVKIHPGPHGQVVTTASGQNVVATKVLVAAGAFANFNGLLDEPAELRLKSEVVVLGEVTAADAERLRKYPTVKYLNDIGDLEAIYMISPVLYEDGRWYIKAGANTRLDTTFTDLDQIQAWFNSDTDPDYLPMYEAALRALWPTVDFVSMRTQPCIITYSPDRYPLIRHLGDNRFIATAGNGGGAKGSDAWGRLAADLVLGGDSSPN